MNTQGKKLSSRTGVRSVVLRTSQLAVVAVTCAFAAVGFQPAPNGVYIQIDDTVVYQETQAQTVAEVLTTQDVAIEMGSIVAPGEETAIEDGMYITISTPKTITLQIGAQTETIETTALTIEELIEEQHIDTEKSLLQTFSPKDYVQEGTTIIFNETTSNEDIITETQPYITTYVEDANLYVDEEKVIQDGIDREIQKTYAVSYLNGSEVTRELQSEVVLVEGQEQIIAQGTKQHPTEVQTVAQADTETAVKSTTESTVTNTAQTMMTMEMSGYSIEGSCQSVACYTASGYNLNGSSMYQHPTYGAIHIVAADPSVLPLGTIIDVNGFGRAIVLDTGGYIIGNRLDFLFMTDAEALSWGRGNITISIVE